MSRLLFYINTAIEGAYAFSSGKGMGVFKVRIPRDVGEYYRLDESEGHRWMLLTVEMTPTNTPAGGAARILSVDTTAKYPPMTLTDVS